MVSREIIFILHLSIHIHGEMLHKYKGAIEFIRTNIFAWETYLIKLSHALDLKEELECYQLCRESFNHGRCIGFLDSNDFLKQRQQIVTHGRPIFVLKHSNVSEVHKLLRKVSDNNLWGLSGPLVDVWYDKQYPKSTCWLIFINKGDMQYVFNNTKVPFDSEVLVVEDNEVQANIFKVFRHENDLLQRTALGVWVFNAFGGTGEWFGVPRAAHRNDLQGVTIRAVTAQKPPLTIISNDGKQLHVKGMIGELWSTIEEDLNLTTKYELMSVSNRLMLAYKLVTNEADIVVCDMYASLISIRSTVFVQPLIHAKSRAYIAHPGFKKEPFAMIKPFELRIWITIAVVILLFSIALLISKQRIVIEEFINIINIFSLQGIDEASESMARNATYLMAYLSALMISTAYSASLISHLSARTLEMPFSDILGMRAVGGYNICSVNGGGESDTLLYSRTEYGHNCWSPSLDEGLQKVCNSSTVLFAAEHEILATPQPEDCKLVSLDGFEIHPALTIVITRKSPYHKIINNYMQQLRERGMLHRMQLRARRQLGGREAEGTAPAPVGTDAVAAAGVCLGVGIAIAALLLLGENVRAPSRRVARRLRPHRYCRSLVTLKRFRRRI